MRLAIAVLAAALGLLEAQPKPFSHKLHLKLKLECTGCHASAAKSTSAADNLLPDNAVCAGCHKNMTMPAPAVTPVAHFSHARHLQLGNIAPVLARAMDSGAFLSPPGDERTHLNGTNPCVACHRGLEESEAVGKANLPRMADCLVCHNQIDPPDSCELCHAKSMALKPVDHTPDFLDKHNRKGMIADKASCAVCHGRKFTCLGCH